VLVRLGRHTGARHEVERAIETLDGIGAAHAAARAGAVRRSLAERDERPARAAGLTRRELDVLRLVAAGRATA
jgi:hypothetical protein